MTCEQKVQHALDVYQEEMISRAVKEVALSLVNTEMLHGWERSQDSPIMKVGGHALAPKRLCRMECEQGSSSQIASGQLDNSFQPF
jgi:hypothetical protein